MRRVGQTREMASFAANALFAPPPYLLSAPWVLVVGGAFLSSNLLVLSSRAWAVVSSPSLRPQTLLLPLLSFPLPPPGSSPAPSSSLGQPSSSALRTLLLSIPPLDQVVNTTAALG